MKLEHVYNTIQKAMTELESVDLVDISKRKQSQIKVNKVYDILDNFKDELIREKIKNGRHK
jgi:DNA-binding transcriptional regulator YhcF (GntR family)